eukprot:6466177-Amphidinium_carterae.1
MVMDVCNSVGEITDVKLPVHMNSLVNGLDAEKACEGFMAFKDVVKIDQVSAASALPSVPSGDAIGVAAKNPFLQGLSDVCTEPLPGVSAPQSLKAIDKMIVMDSQADGNLL